MKVLTFRMRVVQWSVTFVSLGTAIAALSLWIFLMLMAWPPREIGLVWAAGQVIGMDFVRFGEYWLELVGSVAFLVIAVIALALFLQGTFSRGDTAWEKE